MDIQMLMNKLILLLLCILAMPLTAIGWLDVAAMLTAVGVSAIGGTVAVCVRRRMHILYLALCVWRHEFLYLLPLVLYDMDFIKPYGSQIVLCFPLLLHLDELQAGSIVMILGLGVLGVVLHIRYEEYNQMIHIHNNMRDEDKERELYLEYQNHELLEKQEYEIRLATLSERNRIAREIHDNVGHLLTRSLLQVGAMQVIHREDQAVYEELLAVKESLTDAMGHVRNSVHDLHDESIDLQMSIQRILSGFSFCPVKLTYDVRDMPRELKYSVMSIIKEALSNISKHSNATKADVVLLEHPAFYQLIIEDNGTRQEKNRADGMGLHAMRERVEEQGGIIHMEYKQGFRIFISIKKAEKHEDHDC